MPPQDAPDSAPATVASPPPLLPIPAYRLRQFEMGVGERLRAGAAQGIAEPEILATIARERMALATALDQENFRDAFARAYVQAHNTLTPVAPVSDELAHRATDDILDHRINDARQLAQLVGDANFVARARSAPPKPPGDYELPPEKISEMVARFTAAGSSYGLDARIHNQHSMEGHRLGHLALAKVYDANGPLAAPLQQNLTAELPGIDPQEIQRLTADWLEARRQPAVATAEALAERGVVYQQVMQRDHAHAGLMPLLATTALTPQLSEANKTRQQKAEDVIYTLNHALTCLSITDLLVMPTVNGVLGTVFGSKAPKLGCSGHGHGHSHGHAHDDHGHGHGHESHGHHDHHDHHHHSPWDELKAPFRRVRDWFRSDAPLKEKLGSIGSNTRNWLISEAAGDVGAVVPTIVLQRYAPGFMQGVRNTLEPMVGSWFRRGSEKAARQWADKNGLDYDSQECVDRAKELYEYEVRHLPQMAVWTLSSIGISYGAMKWLSPAMGLGEFARTKVIGAGVTAGLVVGARAFSPNAAHRWDQSVSKHLIVPTTKILGKPFGVRTEDVDKFNEKHRSDDLPSLEGRVAAPMQPRAEAALA